MITLTAKQVELRVMAQSDAKHILAVGGSRSGKTFGFCYGIDRRAWKAAGSRHLIYRKHAVSTKQSIGMDTFPKIHGLTGDPVPKWHDQDGFFEYANGSEVWLSGFDSSNLDKVLGKEYCTIYGNEASEFPYEIREQVLTRLAQQVLQADGRDLPLKEYTDLNPTTTAHWTYKLWLQGLNPASGRDIDKSSYVSIFINPHDNRANLPPSVFKTLDEMSERSRRRFLLGEYSADVEEALWRRNMIQHMDRAPGDLDRIVIAIDPAISTKIGSDETGIVACGIKGARDQRKGYVLEDASGKFRPEEWARVALALYDEMKADCIVAEINQGGDMVEQTIRAIEAQAGRRPARVKTVQAIKGKALRAEPIAALYERKLIWHIGDHSQLEDQMTSFTVDFDRRAQGYSPDRLDAMVWAFTELFPALAVSTGSATNRSIPSKRQRFFA